LFSTLSAHAQTHKIPFTVKDGAIWVDAKVNGFPARLKLDTGATQSVFPKKFQTVHIEREVEVRTAGGMVKAVIAPAHYEIGDLRVESTATYLQNYIDQGLIGLDVLRQFEQVIIDFRAQTIEFIPFH